MLNQDIHLIFSPLGLVRYLTGDLGLTSGVLLKKTELRSGQEVDLAISLMLSSSSSASAKKEFWNVRERDIITNFSQITSPSIELGTNLYTHGRAL